MSTIDFVEPANQELLAQLEAKAGGKRNQFLRAFAHKPESMASFLSFYRNVMGPGSIDRRLKELTYLAVSVLNACAFCQDAHLSAAQKSGVTLEEVDSLRREDFSGFNELERSVLEYALELTRTADAVASREALAAQLNSEQMVELTLVVAMANFTNRFNNGLEVYPAG